MLRYSGIAANGGIAIGPAYHFNRSLIVAEDRMLINGEIDEELDKLSYALERSKQELHKISAIAEQKAGKQGSAIFEAQRLMLDDAIVLGSIRKRIRTEQKTAAFVVDSEFSHHQHFLQTSESPLLRERADDVEDVKQRLLRHLIEKQKIISKLDHPAIVVAEFLTPGDAILFSRHELLGFAMDGGGATSHVSILSRSLGLPAIVGLRGAAAHIETGDILIVDGDSGELFVTPDDETLALYRDKLADSVRKKSVAAQTTRSRTVPPTTEDNHRVTVSMNMELIGPEAIEEAERVSKIKGKPVRGLGLVRTEHFLTENDEIPSEQEQTRIYSDLAKRFSPAPITIRTFDIGGDKLIGGGFRERNPFLGWRGIRNLLDQPDILETQLRAILRASAFGTIKLLFPMVTTIDELERTLLHFESAKRDLRSNGEKFDDEMQFGVMIEVPAAALHAPAFAARCDFLSIGSNDLTQYTLAVDRGNEFISYLFDELHPAVLTLIAMTVRAAHQRKKLVSLCGEMGGKLAALPFIVGLGLDEISVAPNKVEQISSLIRMLNYRETQALTRRVLDEALTIPQIKQHLYKFLHKRKLDSQFLTREQIETLAT
ncbi:MAG TPA: phosphoenolpyruvate--protein phosphotransferase [Candidatus Kapabacteria bacterium]|nr:phosphoenolpyruvate--protein phosphotransferase [Candidatus Kapabacteria bacterium]